MPKVSFQRLKDLERDQPEYPENGRQIWYGVRVLYVCMFMFFTGRAIEHEPVEQRVICLDEAAFLMQQ